MATLSDALQRALGSAYRVERELGGGGMSRVFVAEEVALGRRVAIKVLVPEAFSDVSADRFQQEMQLAAQLQHPAILPLLGTGSQNGLTWFTMPFVAGESLRAKLLRDGALPTPDVLRFARDLFEALSAAHAAGIVHRDIKPENLLVSGRHLLVADFGVARALSRSTLTDHNSARLTGVGMAIGTPAYMAPEQALADELADHRVDLYAAGLVLYEMLRGVGPFNASTPQAMIAAQINVTPENLNTLRPDAPPALLQLTMQCLAKSPSERPATAQAALDLLESVSEATTSATRGGVAVQRQSRTLQWLVGGVVALAVGAGAAWMMRTPPSRTGPKDLIVVGDFAHAPADSALARALSNALRTDIGASRDLRVPDAIRIRATLRSMQQSESSVLDASLLADLASRLGAKAYLEGGVDRAGAGFVFTAQLFATDGNQPLASLRESAPDSSNIIDAMDRLARSVRESAGESVSSLAERTALPLFTTRSLAALERVGEGQQLIMEGRSGDAVNAFRAATRLDSNFASAWRGLAVSLGNIGTRPSERFDALKRAHALRERLPEAERFAIEGTWYSFLGDHERSADSWRALAAADPDGTAAPNNLAIALQRLGRHHEAIAVIREALPRSPGSVTFRGNLQNASLELGDTLVADSIAALPAASLDERIDALATKRRYDEAYHLADSALRAAQSAEAAYSAALYKGQTALVLGRLREATQMAEEMISRSEGTDAALMAHRVAPVLATLQMELLGDTARGIAYLNDMLRRYPLSVLDPVSREYSNIAAGYAGLGDTVRAQALFTERAREMPSELLKRDTASILVSRAVVAMSRGETSDALRLLRLSDALSGFCRNWCSASLLARVYDRAGNSDSALVAIDSYLQIIGARRTEADAFDLAWALKRSGELYESRGDATRAIVRYRELVQLWQNADEELQPIVRDLRERIARLESRRG